MVFTVTRSGGSAGAVSATYTITDGTTDASDFGAGFTATGTVSFADGETTAQIHVPIHGDTTFEPNETFSIALSAPTRRRDARHGDRDRHDHQRRCAAAGTLSIANVERRPRAIAATPT